MTEMIMESDVLPDYIEDEQDSGKRYTHVVNPPQNLHIWHPGMSSQDIVDSARRQGLLVRALCGYAFIPVHNPDKYEACQICMDIAQTIISDMEGNNG